MSIIQTLQTLRKGKTLSEFDEALCDLVRAVQETRRAGTVTLVLKVSPASKSNSDQVLIDDKISTKSPELERNSTLFFPDQHGGLHRRDPRQDDLPGLGQVDKETGEIKKEKSA